MKIVFRCSKTINFIKKLCLVVNVLTLLPCYAIADYGESSISIDCDKKNNILEIIPYIMWNEELDNYLQLHPTGISENNGVYIQVFNTDFMQKLDYHCNLSKDNYTIIMQNNKLILLKNEIEIYNKEIDYTWSSSYSLEINNEGEIIECCGTDTGTENSSYTCDSLTKSKTTNCGDVKSN